MAKSKTAGAARPSSLLRTSRFAPHTVVSVSDFDDVDWKLVEEKRDAGSGVGQAMKEVRVNKDFRKRFRV